jgi:ribosomal protein S18 acetylase RimI-like enzyme
VAPELRIIRADLDEPSHRAAVLAMTREYARDPMGNGADLPDELQAVLIDRLRSHPTTLIFLAFHGDQPVGIVTCFLGFSTFAARPLLNIHDLHVTADHRGQGIGRSLLGAVEGKARELGCCKLTLEVQENNHAALALYHGFGFENGQYEPAAGAVLFRQKKL